MPNMKAITLIREAWKMVSNQTIYNCWKKQVFLIVKRKKKKLIV